MPKTGTRSFLMGLALVACPALVAACGGQDHSGHNMPMPAESSHAMPGMDMPNMGNMGNMGDPSATPADKIAGANLRTSPFVLLDTRPPGMDHTAGTAWLATHPHGTTVTVKLTGLQPGDKYMAHLHAKPCAVDHGGDHFRFDPNGPAKPPNEIHLMFTADAQGQAFMTVNNDRAADGAKSLVVHPSEATDNRLVCANF